MAGRLEELNVTPEELERFKSAFQDSRFRELFAQYAEEISDPENRRRYEREISEMERERGVDIHFLHPEPGHVLHTSQDGQRSCYLNVCSNGMVRRPHCVPGTNEEGRSGQHWSLPCSLSPAREQHDPEGGREVLYDVIFHPETLRLAADNDKFKAMVDLTALETVAQSFHVALDTGNARTLGEEKYRGVPQTCVLRKPRPGAKPKPKDPAEPLTFPYPYNVPGGQGHPRARAPPRAQPLPRDPKANQEPTVPRYTIRHRSYVDMQDYRDARDSAPSPVPRELVVTVDLPLLSSAANVALHIEGKAMSLESQRPAYRLQLKLPYLVEDRGTAQYNKVKRQLVVTLPVVQQNVLKLMQDQLANVPEHEPKLSASPAPAAQEAGDAQEPAGAGSDDPPSGEEPDQVKEPSADRAAIGALAEVSPECPIFTCSQDATSMTLVIHVKDIDEHSITSEVGSYQCETRFCVKHSNSPYVLFVQFLPQYNITNDVAVKVSEDNIVIELTKSSECFGLWKNLYFGVNSNALQERRFINEDNVAEFLDSGLRPSTIPWSTLEDQPLIHVLEMNEMRTRIRLNKPELDEESYLAPRERFADVNDVKKQISYQSDESGHSDTGAEISQQGTQPGVESPDGSHPLQTDHCAACTCSEPQEEDEGLHFKEIPASKPDEDDLPDVTERAPSPEIQNSEPSPILQQGDAKDGSADISSDRKTQCAFRFENALLFELD